jgi:tRNA pseudouridine38-40 synthase
MGSERLTTVRTISELRIIERNFDGHQWVTIEVTADGFLYNMVRCIAGTLALVGLHKRPVEWVREVIDSRDRMLAGPTAPSHALILVSVHYELEHLPESTRAIQ